MKIFSGKLSPDFALKQSMTGEVILSAHGVSEYLFKLSQKVSITNYMHSRDKVTRSIIIVYQHLGIICQQADLLPSYNICPKIEILEICVKINIYNVTRHFLPML